MSENKMSQQERDAAFIAEMRESCRVIEKADRTYSYDEDYHIARDYFYANRNHLPFAALRTIDRQQAEIERLTAALATAEAERDAATNSLKKAFHYINGVWLHSGEEASERIDEAHAILFNALTDEQREAARVYDPDAPQPAAAPAVDAAPVGDATPSDEIIGVLDAISDAEHHHEDCAPAISQYEKLDGKTNLTLDALRALTLLVDSLEYDIRTLKVQKGETQS